MKNLRMLLKAPIFFSLPALLLVGCTPNTPVSDPPASNVPYETAIIDIDQHINDTVRWGGIIQGVENTSTATIIELVETPTTKSGRPYTDKGSNGRFKAVFDGFIDPATFSTGNMLTVIGTISGTDVGKIGEYDYTYPMIDVGDYQQWDRAAYERQRQRSRMNVGFGWGGGRSGAYWGFGFPGRPYDCDIYGDCEYYW